METLEDVSKAITSMIPKNSSPFTIEKCGCMSDNTMLSACPKHWKKMIQNSNLAGE